MKNNKALPYFLMATLAILIAGVIWIAVEQVDTSKTVSHKTVEPLVLEPAIPEPPLEKTTLNNELLYITIAVLSLTTLLSIAISFYLYKWRKILLLNSKLIVPEEWAKSVQQLSKTMNGFTELIGNGLNNVVGETRNNTTKISNMTETYMELQSALDDKDKEIKRLKGGYDAEIFSRFISRFARIDQSIDDFILEDGESESLNLLKGLFEDAFDECGISKYVPEIGSDYRKEKGVSDNPKIKKTDNPDEDYLICEVLESGYQFNTAENKRIIIPSKVRIYKLG